MEGNTARMGRLRIPELSRSEKVSLVVPFAVILLAEFLFFDASRSLSQPMFEHVILVHAANIVFCIVYPMITKADSGIFQAFSLISLLRILNIGMPSFTIYTLQWIPLIYVPVILVAAFSLLDEKFDFSMEPGEFPYRAVLEHYWQGLKAGLKSWYFIPIGAGIGMALSMTEYFVLRNQPMVPDYTMGSFVILFIVMFLCIGLGEEMLFRSMLQGRVQTKIGPVAAVIMASILFGMMHSGYANPVYMGYVFLVSLVFGYLYYRTNSLLLITVVHGTINFFLFSIMPYLFG